MQSYAREPDPLRPRPRSVSSGGERKQLRKVHTRKIVYRVGYSWNKGGRLKELRIRHLARKFLKIWMQNTFGRILPHKAKSHYNTGVLKQAFAGWRDEWWTSRREWSLTMRAECHHRYYLYNLAFQSWQMFMSLHREKKSKVHTAQSFADMQRMRLVWERWEVFTEMRRMKKRMLESTLGHKRLVTLHSTWRLWRTRLQQNRDLHTLDAQALKQRALTLQSRTWLQWKEMHTAACCQKEKESKAALHFMLRLKRKTLHHWKSYVSSLQTKKKSQAVAHLACNLHLVMMCWSKWSSALHRKQCEEDRLQAAGHLAIRITQRRALERWKAYVSLCREEAERNRIASQSHHHHQLHAGLQGLSLHVIRNKTHRLNNHMAVQHYHQTITCYYWKLWQDRLEEAEDKSFQPQAGLAVTNHRTSLLSRYLHHWRERLAEQQHMQELEHRADIWFAEGMLPRSFNLWVEFTLQRRLHKQRTHTAEVFHQRRQYSLVFYTWWGRVEKHKERMLSERMAILHEERCHLQKAWTRWWQRTEQQMDEEEKQEASERLHRHRLLHRSMTQWKDNSTEIRDRRNRELQACHQGDLCCMRLAVDKWKKFVQCQRVKKSKVKEMQRYHEVKLLKHTFVAWKKHHRQMCQIYGHAEELYRQHKQTFLRTVLCVWRDNAALQTELRLTELRAQNHFQHFLQLQVFLAWREGTACAASKRHQQGEAVNKAQKSRNQVRLLHSFRRWRKQTREARRERMCMEKARQQHDSKLLSKALKAWKNHHNQLQKNKVMRRQVILLLRLKMYQTYFDQWRMKLQHRRREAKQTERALWHWSLTLQAKVLCGWRLQVTEQRRKQEQAASAAQVYRDQLLREGVTCILTYAAHMSDLTTSLTQHSQEQRSRHLQRAVKRCAMRWKQRALCERQREQEVKGPSPKKSVTFGLATCGLESVSLSDSEEQEAEYGILSKLLLSRAPRRQPRRCVSPLKINTQNPTAVTSAETAPKPSQLSRPSQQDLRTASPCLHPPSTRQSIIISNMSSSEPSISTVDSPQETPGQGVLLPPSAFMTTVTEVLLGTTNWSGFGDAPRQFVPPFEQHSSAYSDERQRASIRGSVEGLVTDPTSALTRELLSIQLDMVTYQQDRKQLRAWQRLKEVLQSWLQTSGKEEQMETNAVCQELKELEERIDGLSTELAKRKPTMLRHAKRIQHLQNALQSSGAGVFHQKAEEMETDRSVFTPSSA
ncbi:protein SFI1 homolog isoform X2 [Pseudoliparis swirei]|uniref:protein SFI1 homolog isoform X2 n=1 Tax=Pseudoliparis swirei TaxID=2059687 RepID=UPI0024BE240D|nr:protein SFI1 homolog isoform X2 [Pseudoliparis swirei]